MMEDYNIWLHCTWQGLYLIHKVYQLNMAVLMCPRDQKKPWNQPINQKNPQPNPQKTHPKLI